MLEKMYYEELGGQVALMDDNLSELKEKTDSLIVLAADIRTDPRTRSLIDDEKFRNLIESGTNRLIKATRAVELAKKMLADIRDVSMNIGLFEEAYRLLSDQNTSIEKCVLYTQSLALAMAQASFTAAWTAANT